MILTYTCAVCGWPGLLEEQRSSEGGASEEICACCGFQSGYSDDALEVPVEEWRRRWTGSGMPFTWADDALPPAGWDPAVQLEALLTSEPPPLPDLPDPGLRSALEEGDVAAAAHALITGGAVLALAGPIEDEGSVVFIATSNGDLRLPVFSGPGAWQAWATAPSAPQRAGATQGSDLVAMAQARGADWILVDLGGPAPMAVDVERLAGRIVVDPPRDRAADGPPPAPDLPDNPALRAALVAGDVPAAAHALAGGAVVFAMLGPADDDALVLVEAPSGETGLLVFTGPEPWEAWARRPGNPSFAGAIEGSRLLAAAEAQRVDQVVVDLARPFSVVMTLEQLRALTALPPLNP